MQLECNDAPSDNRCERMNNSVNSTVAPCS